MHTRIRHIIDFYAHGKIAEFARIMGWTPQYAVNMTKKNGSVGIQPITAILQKFPDIDARWLILGEGTMNTPAVLEHTKQKLLLLLELEQYIPYMSDSERESIEKEEFDFAPESIAIWHRKLQNNCTGKIIPL